MLEATRVLTAGAGDSGRRLDHFLTDQFPEQSRSSIRRWIDQHLVTVNGEIPKAGQILRPDDQIRVEVPPPRPVTLAAEEIPLRIVYEDEFLVVVDKPAGLVVHPGAGNWSGTMANALLHHFRKVSRDQTLRPGIVHRLDKGTSGLIVVARSDRVHDLLSAQFKARTVEKEYLTLVFGRIEPESGQIDLPLGRDPKDRKKFSTRARRWRTALTDYRVEKYLESFSYLKVRIHTGRTHQIRVHLEAKGHPVVGDVLYAGNRWKGISDPQARARVRELGRIFLHASRLVFTHPGGQRVCFESALPPELAGLLDRLE